MRVYRIFRSDLQSQFLVPVHASDDERLVTLNQRDPEDPLPDGTLVALIDTDDDGAPLLATDFPWLQGNVPVFTEHAYERLSPLLNAYGRPFSLQTEAGATFVAFFVDRVIDALDVGSSEISRFSSGRVMSIDRHVFLQDAIGDAAMFRLADIRRAGWTYVTDEYVETVLGSGLRGADFDLVWTRAAD